jgi:WhiB family redox-sensing transcriptional regulator
MGRADTQWMDQARCNGMPFELFFHIEPDGSPHPEAKRLCDACDVRADCLAHALDPTRVRDTYGVWGGTSKTQRDALRRGIFRSKCPICLDTSVYTTFGQQVCLSCGQSWATTRRRHPPATTVAA